MPADKTRAREIVCSVCEAPAGAACDLDAGSGWEPVAGRYHQVRVTAAARVTRETNLRRRRGYTPP